MGSGLPGSLPSYLLYQLLLCCLIWLIKFVVVVARIMIFIVLLSKFFSSFFQDWAPTGVWSGEMIFFLNFQVKSHGFMLFGCKKTILVARNWNHAERA